MAGLPPDSAQRRVLPNTIDSPWSGVGAVIVAGATYSGVLLDRRHVLTAAHVAAGQSATDVSFRINAGRASATLTADRIRVHPRYQGFGHSLTHYDAAIIRLAQPAAAAVAIHEAFYGSLRAGTVLTFIGYGASGRGDEGPDVPRDPGTRRIGFNVIDRFVALPDAADVPGIFVYDFDGPPDPAQPRQQPYNVYGGPSLGNLLETSAASGDSGAPAFIVRGEYRALIGILTFVASAKRENEKPGQSRFGGTGGGILLAPLRTWIEGVLRAGD